MVAWHGYARLVCTIVSLVSSVLLLCLMSKLPWSRRSRLLPRQLWHLALADVLTFFSFLVTDGVRSVDWFWSDSSKITWPGKSQLWCVANHMQDFGIITSAIVEVHMALSVLLAIYRCKAALRCFSHSLSIIWPLGASMYTLDMVSGRPHPNVDVCTWRELHILHFYNVGNLVMFGSIVMCSCAYIVAIASMRTGSYAGRRRVLVLLLLTCLANVVSFGLTSWRSLSFQTFPHNLEWLKGMLYRLDGFLHTCAYATYARSHIRSTRQMIQPTKDQPSQCQSQYQFDVAFGGEEIIPVPSRSMEEREKEGREANQIQWELFGLPPGVSLCWISNDDSFPYYEPEDVALDNLV